MPFFDALAKVFLCLFNDILPRSDKFPWTHYDDDLISVMFVTCVTQPYIQFIFIEICIDVEIN